MMTALGIIAALVSLLVVYGITMLAYFRMRKRHAHARYAVEVGTVLFAVLLSISVKLTVILLSDDGFSGFTGGVAAFWHAVYAGLGGLAFEGISADSGVVAWLQCLYSGTSLYAGLTFVSVITAKASYEIYSRIVLLCKRFFRIPWRRNPDVFVFTALTEDSVKVAKSIADDYRHPREKEARRRKCEIIFCGSDIPAFDKHNEQCREVMEEGFLYWPQAKSSKRSIAKRLCLKNRNRDNYGIRFVVLAFAIDEQGIPKEEENMGTVFLDAQLRAEKDDHLRVEYIVLTKRDINYQAYDKKNRELLFHFIEKNFDELSEKIYKDENIKKKEEGESETATNLAAKYKDDERTKLFQELENYLMLSKNERAVYENTNNENKNKAQEFNKIISKAQEEFYKRIIIDVWNEAIVSARIAVARAIDTCAKEYITENKKELLVWSLGFGEMGQAIVEQLFAQTAFVGEGYTLSDFGKCCSAPNNNDEKEDEGDKNETAAATTPSPPESTSSTRFVVEATRFVVEAFDPNMSDISGLYQSTHPLFACAHNIESGVQKELARIEERVRAAIKGIVCTEKSASVTVEDKERTIMDIISPPIKRYLKESESKNRYNEILESYKRHLGKTGMTEEIAREKIAREMTFPVVRLNSISCMSSAFFDYIDRVTGKPYISDADADKTKDADAGKTIEEVINRIEGNDRDSTKIKGVLEGAKECTAVSRPDIIIIATGDDYRNITLANEVINDAQNELKRAAIKETPRQIVIVVVRDERNNALLISANGTWRDKVLAISGMTVIIAGNAQDMYTCDKVVKHDSAAKYVFGYKSLEGIQKEYFPQESVEANISEEAKEKEAKREKEITNMAEAIKNEYSSTIAEDIAKNIYDWVKVSSSLCTAQNGEEAINRMNDTTESLQDSSFKGTYLATYAKSFSASIQAVYGERLKDKFCLTEQEWANSCIWEKESNIHADLFSPVFQIIYENLGEDALNARVLARMSLLEHHRWTRFHIANGWVYTPTKKDELLKRHNCLVPYEMVDDGFIFYDLHNVIWALASAIAPKPSEPSSENKAKKKAR